MSDVPLLRVTNLSFSYRHGTPVLSELNLDVPEGNKLAVLGPNACGKTTLLKTLGGHLVQQNGEIWLEGRNISNAPPQKRPMATVFQDLGLFHHMSVLENVEYGLLYKRGMRRKEAAKEASFWLERFHLSRSARELPGTLSGGMQQRVAITRALAVRPKVLLLDEPTASLDGTQRATLLEVLLAACKDNLCNSLILVTHDLQFAFALCDTLALLDAGRLVQQSSLRDVIFDPRNRSAIEYLKTHNVILGQIDEQNVFRSTPVGLSFSLGANQALPRSRQLAALLRPDQLRFSPAAGNATCEFKATVGRLEYRPNGVSLYLECASLAFRCDLLARDMPSGALAGRDLDVYFDVSDVRFIDAEEHAAALVRSAGTT